MNNPKVYVASRASIPERPAMWKSLRDSGWLITSTWIDEAGPGQTADLCELWYRIESEIRSSDGLILYAEKTDFPLKGAFIEAGMALGMRKPVAVVMGGPKFISRDLDPIGSWIFHGRCEPFSTLDAAHAWIAAQINIPQL